MSTFLELVVKLQNNCGASGAAITQVTGQTGESLRLVNWIKDSWTEIQAERRDWKFKWAEMSQALTAGTDTYDIRTLLGIGQIRLGTGPYTLEPASGSTQWRRMNLLDYGRFVAVYPKVTTTAGFPIAMTELPNGKLRFNAPLDVNYVLKGPYFIVSQTLAANSDTPIMDAQYHDAIFYRALKKWAEFEEASEQFQTASAEDAKWSMMMVNALLPRVGIGQNALDKR